MIQNTTKRFWDAMNSLKVVYKNKKKPILESNLHRVLKMFLGIQEWGHHIFPARFNKLSTAIDFAEYLRYLKMSPSVGPLKWTWKKLTWIKCKISRKYVDDLLWWSKKLSV